MLMVIGDFGVIETLSISSGYCGRGRGKRWIDATSKLVPIVAYRPQNTIYTGEISNKVFHY